ncbi:hypothetical protein PAXRUDRAFT_518229 [Paxillus rubicundulus Ve08.2h10]|uniref:Uncharacterized protein n=1 Tax=Paxillus rubicundulus Ve08.2h10 TaxID=930991 RepID=A0A0D0DNE9_9AGAM|nr:hypothetical protein PAXRUDRAFT_518229 [Paxillus rubicundulus Ve08.2h10]
MISHSQSRECHARWNRVHTYYIPSLCPAAKPQRLPADDLHIYYRSAILLTSPSRLVLYSWFLYGLNIAPLLYAYLSTTQARALVS